MDTYFNGKSGLMGVLLLLSFWSQGQVLPGGMNDDPWDITQKFEVDSTFYDPEGYERLRIQHFPIYPIKESLFLAAPLDTFEVEPEPLYVLSSAQYPLWVERNEVEVMKKGEVHSFHRSTGEIVELGKDTLVEYRFFYQDYYGREVYIPMKIKQPISYEKE